MLSILAAPFIILAALVAPASEPIEELATALASIPRGIALESDDGEDAQGGQGRPIQCQGISRAKLAGRRRAVPDRLIACQGQHLLSERSSTHQQYSFRQDLPLSPYSRVSLRI